MTFQMASAHGVEAQDTCAEHTSGEAPCPTARITFAPFPRWDLLNMVTECRRALGLTANDIAVFRALLSFLPVREGAPVTPQTQTVVFASNAEIAKRAADLDERVLRHAFKRLSNAGLLVRRDSANGKRFPLRRDGRIVAAFGLNLAPAFASVPMLQDLLAELRAEAEAVRSLRAMLQARRQDLIARVCETVHEWLEGLTRVFRRKLSLDDLKALSEKFDQIEASLSPALSDTSAQHSDLPADDHQEPLQADRCVTVENTATDGQIFRHIESQKSENKNDQTMLRPQTCWHDCPELASFFPDPPDSLQKLKHIIYEFATSMQIRTETISLASKHLGWIGLTYALEKLASKATEINKPDAYLRGLFSEEKRAQPMLIQTGAARV